MPIKSFFEDAAQEKQDVPQADVAQPANVGANLDEHADVADSFFDVMTPIDLFEDGSNDAAADFATLPTVESPAAEPFSTLDEPMEKPTVGESVFNLFAQETVTPAVPANSFTEMPLMPASDSNNDTSNFSDLENFDMNLFEDFSLDDTAQPAAPAMPITPVAPQTPPVPQAPIAVPQAPAPVEQAPAPQNTAITSEDTIPDVPSFMNRPVQDAPRPILFDFDKADAEPIIPQQAEKRTIAPDTMSDDDDFAEASTEATSMPEMSLFDDEAPMAQPEAFAAPSASAQPMVFDTSAAPNYSTEENPKQHYRPVFAGPVPNPIAEAKAARAAARAAQAAAALQALQTPAPAQAAAPAVMAQAAAVASPAIPEAPAVPVLETPVGTPITAPVTPAQPETASFENSFSNLPVFEMPVPETTVSEPAPIEKIPFASNLAALLNGEPETAPPTPLAPEKDFGQDLFADENFFDGSNPFENEFEAMPAAPAEQAYAPKDDATKVFQPLTDADTVASYEDFAPKAPAPAFNPFESNEWKDEIDDYDDTGVIETPVRRTEKRLADVNDGTPARARTSSGSKGKKPKKANQLPLILLLGVLVLAIVGIAVYAISGGLGKKKAPSSVAPVPSSTVSVSTAPSSSSVPLPVAPAVAPIPRDEWYMKLANKQSPLPAEFTVKTGKTADGIDVDERIRGAVNDMIAGAKEQGVKLKTVAGYRSYERQEKSYNSRVAEFVKAGKSKEEAQTAAAAITAPPGASEHNLGLSVDMQSVASHDYADTFKDSAEAKWLLDNAANYGFILRYPQGKEAVTGFEFEPWHYRYVGVDEAQKIKASGLTLEEYLAQDAPTGIPEAAPAA